MTNSSKRTARRRFAAILGEVRKRPMELRELIFKVTHEIRGIEPVTETLKWGEPSDGCLPGNAARGWPLLGN
ncbi:MAG: hypothetical protein M2R45_01295 [Verrucomicrobia subdivision 3 bacterium]|nr:hypothetical protein [Limisphaerales bacterium]MCS1415161.1 hypothetical protein [Limisphaerales bacterium]